MDLQHFVRQAVHQIWEVHWRCILQQERIIELLEQGVQVVDCEAHGFILSNGMTLI